MALIKTFESFIDERERLRDETRQRGSSIVSTFIEEPLDINLVDNVVSADDTLEIGREIAETFPVELVEEPIIDEVPININDEFPVDLVEEEPVEEFSTETEINQEFPVDITGFSAY